VAQSWAATWHPIFGSLVLYVKIWFCRPGFRTRDLPGANDLIIQANRVGNRRFLLTKRKTMYLSWSHGLNERQKSRGLAPALATCPYHMTVQRKFWRVVPSIARTVNNAWPVGLLTSHMTRGLLLFRARIVITISQRFLLTCHVTKNHGTGACVGWPAQTALGHMPSHTTTKIGARAHARGCGPITIEKWVLSKHLVIFKLIVAIFNRNTPFLGDIGHFWRPDSWRKLGMRNQLHSYINQACLRPMDSHFCRVMLFESQAKVNLMQGSL
jgi:hypothetical protein